MLDTTPRPRPPLAVPAGRPARRGRRCALAASLAAGLALAACSPGGGDEEPAPAPPAQGEQGAGASTTPTTQQQASGGAGQAPARALGTAEGAIDGQAVRAEVVKLDRDGSVVNLSVRLSLTGGPDADQAQIAGALADGDFQTLGNGESEDGDVFDGPTLVDAANRKLHLVGRDSENRCACDTDLSGRFIQADAPVTLSATFGAPPGDVRAVDVRLPGFGTLDDVPLG